MKNVMKEAHELTKKQIKYQELYSQLLVHFQYGTT